LEEFTALSQASWIWRGKGLGKDRRGGEIKGEDGKEGKHPSKNSGSSFGWKRDFKTLTKQESPADARVTRDSNACMKAPRE